MRKDLLIMGGILLLVIVGAVYFANQYRSSTATSGGPANSSATNAAANMEILIRPDSPALGPENAKVTIVEFYDPECEACAAYSPILKRVMKSYEGQVRLVMRYMPLHPNSLSAATFTEAAGEQGKYWQAQELLFAKQPEWGTKHGPGGGSPPDITALFRKYAAELGLDEVKINQAYMDKRYLTKFDRDKKDGQSLGVRQTPTIFVNGQRLSSLSEQALRSAIDLEINK